MAADLVFAAGADNHIDHGGVGRWIILTGRILGCSRFAVQRDLNGTLGFFLSQISENLRPVTFDDGSLLKQARQLAGIALNRQMFQTLICRRRRLAFESSDMA